MTSSVSVMSSPSLASRAEPQQGQVWGLDHHALARQMGWERLAARVPAHRGADYLSMLDESSAKRLDENSPLGQAD